MLDIIITAAVPAMGVGAVLFGILCLFLVKGTLRLHMAIAVGGFFAALALWLGGNWLLGLFGLVWRAAMVWTFALLVFFSGVWGIVCDVRCLWYLLRKHRALRWISSILAAAAGRLVLQVGCISGIFLLAIAASPERVVVWENGQQVLEVNESFMDPLYVYYEYHGPLVRGSEALARRDHILAGLTRTDAGDYIEIRWEDRTYVPFCVVSKEDCGAFLDYFSDGTRISAYIDYPPEAWLVSWIPQDGGAMLYRELSVTDIPEGLTAAYDFGENLP